MISKLFKWAAAITCALPLVAGAETVGDWFFGGVEDSQVTVSNATWKTGDVDVSSALDIEDGKIVVDNDGTDTLDLVPTVDAPDTNVLTRVIINSTFPPNEYAELDPVVDAKTALTLAINAGDTNYYAYTGSEWIPLSGATLPASDEEIVTAIVELNAYESAVTARFYINGDWLTDANGKTNIVLATTQANVTKVSFAGSCLLASVDTKMQLGVASVDGIKYPTYLDAIAASATATDPTITVLRESTGETVGEGSLSGYGIAENNGVYTLVDNTASTWIGDDDDFWATASNWSTGVVPGQYTTVTFPNAGRIRFAEGNGSVNVGAMVVNANVTFSENSVNYSYYPFINVCGGSISGTGTMTLERCGLKGNGTTLTVGCQVVFAGDSATTHDCFLQNGPIVFNGTVSSTLGRLHLQTPVTFNGAVNLANATITSVITSGQEPTFNGAVTLGAGASIYTYAVTYNDALVIGEGAVVSVGSSYQTYGENFTMTGSGRFIGDTQLPSGKAKTALTQSTWTGTCELKNMTIKSVWWFTDYGNENSKICFNNVTTYLGTGSHMIGGIEIAAGGFKINGTYSSGNWTLPKLSGTGTFTVGTAGNNNKNVYFPADCSEFSGNIAFADDTANTRLVFGTTDREFKEKTICVGSDAVVGAGATWTASDEIYLDGVVKASANTSLSTVVGSGKIVYGTIPTGTHTFGEGWSGIGAIDYKGDSRIDLADYVNTIAQKCSCATVEVVDGCTIPGKSYFGANVTSTLKVSGFVSISDGSSAAASKRTVSRITGDGVLAFGTADGVSLGTVNYAVDNLVGWNGVITNAATATLVTNIVSGTGKVVYTAATPQVFVGDDFDGVVEFDVAPSHGPSISDESECEVVIGYNWSAGANLRWYGGNKSTITVTQFTGDNTYLPDDDIVSKLHIAGTFGISNGNPIMLDSSGWNAGRVIKMPALKVDGTFSMAKTSGNAWSDGAKCCYWTETLDASGEGTISVGSMFALRIDAVDFAEAPDGTDALVALSLSGEGVNMGAIYGPNGVAGEQIPVTVNGVATEQSLVYDAEKGGLVLYVPPTQVTIDIPTVEYTTPSVTADGEPVEIVNGQITVTDGAAIVLTYTSATHEVTNGTIEFTAADGYTVDASGVTTAAYVAKIDGGSSYTSLQAAIDATAQSNSKVVLVADESAGATVPSVNGKMFYFYDAGFEHGEILDATGNFITTAVEETTSIGGEDVTAMKYRVESAFMAVTISGTRTLYGMASANDALAAANAGPLGTTVEFFSGDPASYAAYLPMFTYNEQTGIYTKTLEPVAAVYSGVQQLSVHTSLADAIAAAEDGQTVKLLADDRVSFAGVQVTAKVPSNGSIVINKNITINGAGFTVYGNTNAEIMNATGSSTPGYDMVADLVDGSNLLGFFVKSGNVTFTNITLTEFGDTAYVNKFGYTPIQTASAYTGTLTLTNVNFNKFNRTAVCVRGGTLAMTGGTIAGGTVNKNNGDYFQQPVEVRGGTATISGVTITGGNDISGNGGGAIVAWSSATLNNVVVDFTGYGVWSDGPVVAITGEDTSVEATVNALFAEEAGTITVAAGDFTGSLAVDSDPNSSIVVSGGTFDRQVPAAYCASGKVPTTTPDASGKYTVVDKPSGIDPAAGVTETTVAYENTGSLSGDELTAAVVAEAVTTGKIIPPTGASVTPVAYAAYFTYTVTGDSGNYTLAIAGLQPTVLEDVDASVASQLVSTTTGSNMTVTVKPGLYYGFTTGTTLTLAEPELQLSTGETVTVSKPGTTQGFVKIKVSATNN